MSIYRERVKKDRIFQIDDFLFKFFQFSVFSCVLITKRQIMRKYFDYSIIGL